MAKQAIARRMPWPLFSLAACTFFALCCSASPRDEFGVDLGTDCSENVSCDVLHLDHWDRPTCMARVMARQRKEPRFAELYGTGRFFQELGNGSLANTSDQMTLTKIGCDEFCGDGTFYWDAVPRLTTWIIPVVLLLSNIELSPIDKRRFMTIVHAVGDPIDSFWSILHKIYVWRRLHAIAMSRCHPRQLGQSWWSYSSERSRGWRQRSVRFWRRRLRRIWQRVWRVCRWFLVLLGRLVSMVTRRKEKGKEPARSPEQSNKAEEDDDLEYDTPRERARVIATVLAGFEEVSGAHIESEVHYYLVLEQLGRIGGSSLPSGGAGAESPAAWREWRHCARVLADARTNEFLRTLLAIFVYFFGVVAALDDAIGGGETSKPGGRIGSAVFLMWLVPLSLLSNLIGSFTSRRTCLTIMRLFVHSAKEAMRVEEEQMQKQEPKSGQQPQVQQKQGKPSSSTTIEPLFLDSPAMPRKDNPDTDNPILSAQLGHQRTFSHESASPRVGPRRMDDDGRVTGPMTPGILLHIQPPAMTGGSSARDASPVTTFVVPSTDDSTTNENTPAAQRDGQYEPLSDGSPLSRRHGGGAGSRSSVRWELPTSPSAGHLSPLIGAMDITDHASTPGGSTDGEGPRGSGSEAPLLSDISDIFNTPIWGDDKAASGSTSSRGPLFQQQHENEAGKSQDQPQAALAAEDKTPLLPITSWDHYFNSLQWLGAIYTYRPWKIGYRSVHITSSAHYAPNWFLVLLSIFPVAVSTMGAFVIIWYAVPAGWNCRHLWVILISFAWLVSAGITTWIHGDKMNGNADQRRGYSLVGSHRSHPDGNSASKPAKWSEETRWTLVLIKDFCIGGAGLALVFLSTSGLFNSCWCWSDQMWHNMLPGDWGQKAFVPLNTDDEYNELAQLVYDKVVYACLGAQMLFLAFILFLWWDGISVVRWDEEHRRREWRHEVGDHGRRDDHLRNVTYDDPSYLLFWYRKHEYDLHEGNRKRRNSEYTEKQQAISRRRSEVLMSPLKTFRKRDVQLEFGMTSHG